MASECCVRGFKWAGTPTGHTSTIANHQTYITGSSTHRAIILIHDLYGWTFTNTRLLADHFATEANATVYVPDFFGGEVLDFDAISNGRWADLDLGAMMTRNGREVREPEIFAVATELRAKYAKLAAVGYCYGGWASFRLAAKERNLVDCIVVGHPSMLTKKDMDEVDVPVAVLAPEHDPAFVQELKEHCFQTLLKMGKPWMYQHFAGVEHNCFIRGDESKPGEKKAMTEGKNAAVYWLNRFMA